MYKRFVIMLAAVILLDTRYKKW